VAHQKGQYILSSEGLDAGIRPAPGLAYKNLTTFYSAARLKGSDGRPVPVDGASDALLNQNPSTYTTALRAFEVSYAVSCDLVLANGFLTTPEIGIRSARPGVYHSYIRPFTLGYRYPTVDMTVAFEFAVRASRRSSAALQSSQPIGSAYWGHVTSKSATFFLDASRATTVSVFDVRVSRPEGCQRRHARRDGDIEWGLGRRLPVGQNRKQFGVLGYLQRLTTGECRGGFPGSLVRGQRSGRRREFRRAQVECERFHPLRAGVWSRSARRGRGPNVRRSGDVSCRQLACSSRPYTATVVPP
jgi:hypothetical protein